MEPWLTKSDFEEIIGPLPASFTFAKLYPIVKETVEGWLTDHIGAVNVAAWKQLLTPELIEGEGETSLSVEQAIVAKTIKEFLAYAVWSRYILRSNVIITETGLVTKRTEESDPITSSQRTELYKDYQAQAERKALELTRLVTINTTCAPGVYGSGRPVLRKAQPRSPSRLGN